ncbi:Xenotropic and polytropic retrovirus receptor 1 [Basidiobolus ranarum]|uniref:Xenotropic and polytropic retrovirus receptor 1 n=1 Tax=Basidiobolus ranarum TaxID=34480 RepID=A0ABR2W8Y7_9FUNG
MKFAKYLETESVPEWKQKYIDYKALKKALKRIEEKQGPQKKSKPALLFSPVLGPTRYAQSVKDVSIEQRRASNGNIGNVFRRKSQAEVVTRPKASEREPFLRSRTLNALSMPSYTLNMTESLESTSRLQIELARRSPEERSFFELLDKELEKICQFYDEKEKEAVKRLYALREQVLVLEAATTGGEGPSSEHVNYHRIDNTKKDGHNCDDCDLVYNDPVDPEEVERRREEIASNEKALKHRLEKALLEYYRSVELLKNYKILNHTGFMKILKKFEKTAHWKCTQLYMAKAESRNFVASTILDKIIVQTETLYTDVFDGASRKEAMDSLRIPDLKKRSFYSTALRSGLYIGLSLPVFFRSVYLAMDPEVRKSVPYADITLQIYGGLLLPIIFAALFGINIYVWSKNNVNYRFIFEFDPRDHLHRHQFLELPAFFFMVYSYISSFTFSNPLPNQISPDSYPLILICTMVGLFLCPFRILYYTSRRWLIITLYRIVTSPLYSVYFRDFFIADELNSLGYTLINLQLMACAYSYGWENLESRCNIHTYWIAMCIPTLPAWWRFLQCVRRYQDSGQAFPHLANAGKYISSMILLWAAAGARIRGSAEAHALWIFCAILASCYTYVWDIRLDWGFLEPNHKHKFLRQDLAYPWKWAYYFAIISNLFLRFSWVVTASTSVLGTGWDPRLVAFFLALGEVYRRFQWNFFRMENEHINNVGQYRAIKEIPLPFAINTTEKVIAHGLIDTQTQEEQRPFPRRALSHEE